MFVHSSKQPAWLDSQLFWCYFTKFNDSLTRLPVYFLSKVVKHQHKSPQHQKKKKRKTSDLGIRRKFNAIIP